MRKTQEKLLPSFCKSNCSPVGITLKGNFVTCNCFEKLDPRQACSIVTSEYKCTNFEGASDT